MTNVSQLIRKINFLIQSQTLFSPFAPTIINRNNNSKATQNIQRQDTLSQFHSLPINSTEDIFKLIHIIHSITLK